MRTEIYYFTGTGNTLRAAASLAKKTGGTLIPVASCIKEDKVSSEAEIIGIIFPVYYMAAPAIIIDFAEKLDCLDTAYIFGAATYGGAAGNSCRQLKETLEAGGKKLSAFFGIHMMQNSFYKKTDNPDKRENAMEKKSEKIARFISRRRKGMLLSDAIMKLLLAPINRLTLNMSRKFLAETAGLDEKMTIHELVRHSDSIFDVGENCTGCGLCEKVCPAGNIVMEKGRPVWQNRCENCIACYSWCPEQAVNNKIVKKGYIYHHPMVKISDIMRQRSRV